MKKAIVTGGAGFIGSHIAKALLEGGWEVHAIDDLSFGESVRLPKEVILHQVDIRDTEKLIPICAGASVVFHAAAIASVPLSIEDPARVFSVNASGTVSVLEAARRCGVKRVVYSASSAAYGDATAGIQHEDAPAAPGTPYALAKYEGELYMTLYAALYGIETVSLRYFNVYGVGQNPEGPYAAVIAKFAARKKENLPLEVTGEGEQTRDFVSVFDVARANLLAAQSSAVGAGEVINIGSGKSISIRELAEMFGGEIVYIQKRQEVLHSRASIEKAKELLGFEPSIQIEEGLAQMLL